LNVALSGAAKAPVERVKTGAYRRHVEASRETIVILLSSPDQR
jgi:hypothetical protein